MSTLSLVRGLAICASNTACGSWGGVSVCVLRNFAEFIYLPDQICIHLVRIKDFSCAQGAANYLHLQLSCRLFFLPILSQHSSFIFNAKKKKKMNAHRKFIEAPFKRHVEIVSFFVRQSKAQRSKSSNPSFVRLEHSFSFKTTEAVHHTAVFSFS